MYRKLTNKLIEWKNSPYRKPLILQGARQVGKTYTVLEFARNNYENVFYINFETMNRAKALFDDSIDPKDLVPKLSNFLKQPIMKENTLILFDEVQLCERALTSLKYFNEFAPEYHVIVAGSLLGIALNREEFSFPVGKVNFETLNPMDMEEFLIALDQNELVDKIKICFENNTPIDSAYHDMLMDYYRQFLVVGGMPECVDKFIRTSDYTLIRAAQAEMLASYLKDMSKYNAKPEIKKTQLVYKNITTQLSKKNTRFQYKLVKSGGRAADFESAIEWLALSGLVTQVYNLDTVKKPLDNYKNIDSFKIFLSDTGLLCANKEIIADDIIYQNEALNDFKGGMTENYVCSQLIGCGHTPYSWQSEGEAEIDFIIQREGEIIPVEVKSSDNTRAKSLKIYMQRFTPKYAIKISANNFGFESNVKTIPLYAAFCI